MKIIALPAGLLLTLVFGMPLSVAHPPEPTPNEVFRSVDRIVTPDGIDVDEFVRIGGIEQWVSIRGRHRDAPILLLLHGGPGFTTLPSSYYFLKDWEEYFTLVQWDQRGAGKTYLANDPTSVRPTMSLDRMVDDAEEMVSYLRKTYGRKRIVLVGYSFGTIIGIKLVRRHPDWFYAYVGMGQLVDAPDNEKMGYDATLAAARADHDRQAVRDLEAIAPFPDLQHPRRNLEKLPIERRWLAHYGGYYWHDNVGHEDALDAFSPDYTKGELKARYQAMGFSVGALWPEISRIGLRSVTRFGCPIIFFEGRHDLGTNATLLADWYRTIRAPVKRLVWFEDSAHMAYQEEPGKTLVSLVSYVLPLTRRP